MKDFKIYVFIASILITIYIVVQYEKPKPINWRATYLKTDKIPLGTYILYNQLHDIFPGAIIKTFREPVYNVLNDYQIKSATYLIIARSTNLNESDFNKMLPFIKLGNDVLISASDFGTYLYKKLKISTDNGYDDKGTDSVHFVNDHLDTNKIYVTDPGLQTTHFAEFDTVKAVVIARDKSKNSVLIKYVFGKGALYLSSNPQVFSNYNMLTARGADFTASALSYLKNNKTILWDEYYAAGRPYEGSIMRVFFANSFLKSAYYIALVSLILFVIYKSKREQRIIPVIEPLRNSTVDFINVVGQVYYEARDNSNIAQKKVIYLLDHIRQKYRMQTAIFDQEFISSLATVTAIAPNEIVALFNMINTVKAGGHISDQRLIELNNLIEQFYIKSR